MEDGFRIEHANVRRERELAEIRSFLECFGLDFDADADFTVVVRNHEGRLFGVGSSQGEVLRNIAVDESVQGSGLTAAILSSLMQDMARRGIFHSFIFTLPAKAFLFANLGFVEIARAEPHAALLESGIGSVASFCDAIAGQAAHLPEKRAGLVVNANPFTKGHRALIEKAAAECPGVLVFVVSEDLSLFPAADRVRLVREGVADLPNVVVVEGGKYIISAATFPGYFTRERDRVKAQTRLDIALFARQIAPRLGIVARFAGEEPHCPVTAEYNQAMREILPAAGIAIHIMPRMAVDGEIVSASKARELIRADKRQLLERLVPAVTLAYLRDEKNKAVLDAIRSSTTRH
ncbi:MAG: [citrate (pro-3S)-lyase] ligase [Deltaproteobacteria bacterium]|jgi:[citrate (pro-3S)-lyase] ligase|nr:[citrate (pro-3S)-lyase] ligase [Deltaproteobacteria bacterium]